MSSITKHSSALNNSLAELNQCFLTSHAIKKGLDSENIGKTTPVIIVNGDNLVLRYQGIREEIPYLPQYYHQLKTIAHTPCTLYNINKIAEKQNCATQKADCLQKIQTVIAQLEEEPDHPLMPHLPLLKELAAGDVSIGMEQPKPSSPILRLIDEAARCRIHALHTHTQEIKNKIGEGAWQSVVVIVLGPQMPREGDIAMQYYTRILHVPKNQNSMCPMMRKKVVELKESNPTSQRLIYAESMQSEEAALGLLATHITDEDVGAAVLNDREAMHKDVLSSAGSTYLNELLKDT